MWTAKLPGRSSWRNFLPGLELSAKVLQSPWLAPTSHRRRRGGGCVLIAMRHVLHEMSCQETHLPVCSNAGHRCRLIFCQHLFGKHSNPELADAKLILHSKPCMVTIQSTHIQATPVEKRNRHRENFGQREWHCLGLCPDLLGKSFIQNAPCQCTDLIKDCQQVAQTVINWNRV